MSYVVIARKYRPQDFDDVIGQEAIATTLKNSIALKRVHHAYLFTGPRGVGKTSVARIFAKALNCEKGSAGKACGKCGSCKEIEAVRSLDVIEIDGASNRGIDDIRSTRENVKFAPASSTYKIYIIDEVHQITQDGFNALLKTLEEPPKHAKFIFATTAPQKIPATILSRCQRFDFRRISTQDIANALEKIAEKEKIKIAKDAIYEIAKAADGSLRDSQSLLDQVASYSKNRIGLDEVSEALGVMHDEEFIELFDAIASKDTVRVLDKINNVVDKGKDPVYFMEKCLEHIRNLLVANVGAGSQVLMELQDSYREALQKQSKQYSKQDLFYLFSIVTGGVQNLRRFNTKRVPMEMALLKCTLREPMISLDEISLPSTPSNSSPAISSTPSALAEKKSTFKVEPASKASSAPEAQPESSQSTTVVQAEISDGNPDLDEIWPNFMKRMRADKISAASFLTEGDPLELKDDIVLIGFKKGFTFHAESLADEANTSLIEKHLSELLNQKTQVKFVIQSKPDASHAGNASSSDKTPPQKPDDSPVLKSAMGIFGGRIIKR